MKTQLTRMLTALALGAGLRHAAAQGTAFTYQGRLNTNGSPANGSYDLSFSIYKTPIGGAFLAGPLTNSATAVTNGLFTVTLDFGSNVFAGQVCFMQINVESNGVGPYVPLSPRQQLTPTPYAIYSENAGEANSVISNGVSVAQLNTLDAPASGEVLTYNGTSLVWSNLPSGGGGSNGSLTISTVQTTNNGTDSSAMGFENTASGTYSIVAGGSGNTATGIGGFIGGGANNAAGYEDSVVGGGSNSAANGNSFVGGGYNNAASGEFSVIAGGYNCLATGYGAVVPGGIGNEANGNYTFAAGSSAVALHTGAFVWADDSGGNFVSTAPNQFSVRANGGVRFVTGGAGMTIDGVPVSTGGGGGGSTNGWSLTGNAGTSPSTNFLGTTDSASLAFRVARAFP